MYPSPYIKFKSSRIEREWFAGSNSADPVPKLHPVLYIVVLAAAYWYYQRTGEHAVLTGIIRTRDEQLSIYPDKPKRRSVHEFGRGVDLRIGSLSDEEKVEWKNWINQTFEYQSANSTLQTALIHQVGGLGEHLHIQIGPLELKPETPDNFITA